MVYNGKSYWNWWFRGTPILGNLHIGSLKPTFPLWTCMFRYLRALGSLPSPNLRFCVGAMMGLASKINLKITAVVHGPWSQHASNMAVQWEFHMPDITKHYKTMLCHLINFSGFVLGSCSVTLRKWSCRMWSRTGGLSTKSKTVFPKLSSQRVAAWAHPLKMNPGVTRHTHIKYSSLKGPYIGLFLAGFFQSLRCSDEL